MEALWLKKMPGVDLYSFEAMDFAFSRADYPGINSSFILFYN